MAKNAKQSRKSSKSVAAEVTTTATFPFPTKKSADKAKKAIKAVKSAAKEASASKKKNGKSKIAAQPWIDTNFQRVPGEDLSAYLTLDKVPFGRLAVGAGFEYHDKSVIGNYIKVGKSAALRMSDMTKVVFKKLDGVYRLKTTIEFGYAGLNELPGRDAVTLASGTTISRLRLETMLAMFKDEPDSMMVPVTTAVEGGELVPLGELRAKAAAATTATAS